MTARALLLGIDRGGGDYRAGIRAALRQRLLPLACGQPAAIHRARHRLGPVLRPDALCVARDHRLLRRRRLHRRRARRSAAVAAGAADRGDPRRAARRRRRPLDAPPERRLFRHLHLWPRRTGAPARGLVRGQQVARARALRLRRHHANRHLLAIARARRRGVRARLADRALAHRLCAPHHRRRTRPSPPIAASTPRS